jgi:antibiotic biosynthesis monooxygenase (ABM) superfamily enzyme
MAKGKIINIIVTECAPENDAKFNKWYNEVHIPMLMKYKGIKKVTRYRVIGEEEQRPKFIAIYEYDTKDDLDTLPKTPEFQEAIAEMQETWKGNMPDIKMAISAEPIETWEQ